MIFFQYLANGLILGGLYACIAAGFSLVWGVLSIINLLHGSFIVLGFYIAYFSYTMLGIHPFVSVVTSAIVLGAIGYVVQLGLINRVVTRSVLVTLILTFGLELMMNNAMLVSFSADYKKVLLEHPLGIAHFGNVFIPLDRAASTVIAFLLILLLWLVLRLTSVGRAIVAVRFDRDAALLMGIDVNRTYAITFALGAALAGAAGSLLSASFPVAPLSGPLFLSKAFVICVLGRRRQRSRCGGRRAGLWSAGELWRGAVRLRICADAGLCRADHPAAGPAAWPVGRQGLLMTRTQLLLFAVVIAVLLAMPLLGNNYVLRLATTALMYAVLTMAWNVVGGFAGYPLFGIAAFFGLGAYSGAVVQSSGYPVALAWIVAVIIGTAFAIVLGFILLRLRGHAFAIATLVVAEVLARADQRLDQPDRRRHGPQFALLRLVADGARDVLLLRDARPCHDRVRHDLDRRA